MLFEFGFYSSLLLITFSQGLLYSILLAVKALTNEINSNYWLSFFLLLCCLYIAPWMLGFAGWYDSQPYRDILFYIPFQNLFLFGPVIYFYTQSLLNTSYKFTRNTMLHFVPGCFYILYSGFMWIYDEFWHKGYYFYDDGIDKDFDAWYQYTGSLAMILYLIASLRYYEFYRKMVYQFTSFADSILFKWIKTYLIAFLILILLPLVFDVIGIFYPQVVSYKGSWWYFLAYSLVMYYLAIKAYSNPLVTNISFSSSSFNQKPALLIGNDGSLIKEIVDIEELDTEDTIETLEIKELKLEIEKLILADKLYQNPELTLHQVAARLEKGTHIVSKAINTGFKMNFNDLINGYRVEAVKKCLAEGKHHKSTLLGIAYDCGFNSKATFNRAFKKFSGCSPKDYLESISDN